MKSLLIIITLFTFSNISIAQSIVPISIKVTYVACSIETVFAIPCSLFDSSFSNDKEYGELKNSEITKMGASLKNFVKIKTKGIDVRGKIQFTSNRHTYKYCFDCAGIFTDGVNLYKNPKLFLLLKKRFRSLNF